MPGSLNYGCVGLLSLTSRHPAYGSDQKFKTTSGHVTELLWTKTKNYFFYLSYLTQNNFFLLVPSINLQCHDFIIFQWLSNSPLSKCAYTLVYEKLISLGSFRILRRKQWTWFQKSFCGRMNCLLGICPRVLRFSSRSWQASSNPKWSSWLSPWNYRYAYPCTDH